MKNISEFETKLKKKQPILYNSIEILEPYINSKTKILIKNKYGLCKVTPAKLMFGSHPTIKSAVNRNSYFQNMLKESSLEVYKSIIGFGDFKGSEKYIIILTEYGYCKVIPNNLLRGNMPTIRSAINKNKYFRNMLVYKFPNILNELKLGEYKNDRLKITAENKYGICLITPNDLLRGKNLR